MGLAHPFGMGVAHVFLLRAVMSLDALTILSRRSWCSSSSLRKVSKTAMNGETGVGGSAVSSSGRGCLMPAMVARMWWGGEQLGAVQLNCGLQAEVLPKYIRDRPQRRAEQQLEGSFVHKFCLRI